MRRLLALLRTDDRGTTLAEMVVTMFVGGLLLACVSALTIAQIRGIDGAQKRTTATNEVTNALDLTTKELRTAITPATNVPAFLTATGETVGFYANLNSLASNAAATAAYTPQEVWVWTRTVNGKRQLCNQVRPLTRNAAGTLVFPTVSLANESSRTCHILVSDLATVDSIPTFTYLAASDDVSTTTGLSTSSVALSGGAVVNTTDIQGVQIRVRAKAGTSRESNTVTSVVRVALINSLS